VDKSAVLVDISTPLWTIRTLATWRPLPFVHRFGPVVHRSSPRRTPLIHRRGAVFRRAGSRSAEIGSVALVHTIHTPMRDDDG
jgi:hypothetical protein